MRKFVVAMSVGVVAISALFGLLAKSIFVFFFVGEMGMCVLLAWLAFVIIEGKWSKKR